VPKVDGNKSLNQSAKIAKSAKIKQINKSEKTEIDFAYGNAANQIEMLNGSTSKIYWHWENIAIMDSGFPGVE
jgi:hypothetical protein